VYTKIQYYFLLLLLTIINFNSGLVRSEAWPLLLNLSIENKPLLNLENIKDHPEYNQVVMDVRRCLKRFPPGISYERIGLLQEQLIEIILSIITEHKELKYYQVIFLLNHSK
jgi:hypothetical protein